MDSHKNAKLTSRSREKMARRLQFQAAADVAVGYA